MEKLGEKLPLLLVVLFGSYAKKNYTVASDVDLLIVYSGEKRDDAFSIVKKSFRIPVEPHVYSEEEYKEMEAVLSGMTKGGIILFSKDRGNNF